MSPRLIMFAAVAMLAELSLFVFARVNGGFIPWFLLYFATLCIVYEFCTWRCTLCGIELERHLTQHRLFAGQRLEVTIQVRRRNAWPLLYLRVMNGAPDRLAFYQHRSVDTLTPMWRQTMQFHSVIEDVPRGVYTFGDMQVQSGDMFGVLRLARNVVQRDTLTVYPKVVPVRGWTGLKPEEYGHRQATRRRTEESTNVLGIRDYVAGDRLSRIHWPASARTGQLKAKEFELHVTSELIFVPDVSATTFGSSRRQPAYELEMTIVASLMKNAHDLQRQFGLLLHGKRFVALTTSAHPTAYIKCMDALAASAPDGTVPFPQTLTRIGREANLGSLFVVVSPLLDNSAVMAAATLRTRGPVEWFVPSLEQPLTEAMRGAVDMLQSIGVTVYLIGRDSQLSALQRGGVSRASSH